MCGTCGCGQEEQVTYTKPGEGHHHHNHDHGHHHEHHHHDHDHEHGHSHRKEIQLETDVLSKNNLNAQRNRGYFEALNIRAYNLVSSPGSGKTSLLEKTIADLKDELSFFISTF